MDIHPLLYGRRVAHLLPPDDGRASAVPKPCADALPLSQQYRRTCRAVRIRRTYLPQSVQKGIRRSGIPMAHQETGGKHPLPAVTIFYSFDGHYRRVQLFFSATLQQFLQTISRRYTRQPEKSDAGCFGVSLPLLTFYNYMTDICDSPSC